MIYAAGKKGRPVESLLDLHDTTARWKAQYQDTSEFLVPGTAAICDLKEDDSVKLLPPVVKPKKKERPRSATRKDNHYNKAAEASSKKKAKGKSKM